MKLEETPLQGARIVRREPIEDERGYFARVWSKSEFEREGLTTAVDQCSVSFNKCAGTLRGMHYQAAPHAEAKLVTCVRGRIFDVIVDLRRASATFTRWFGLELAASGGAALFVPEGFAHGFVTLEDDTMVHYQISQPFRPELARGVRWDDPAFGIVWPAGAGALISPRDRAFAAFDPGRDGFTAEV